MPIRRITVEPVLNGFYVTVGCQQLVFRDRNLMLKELKAFLENPEKVEKRYRDKAMRAKCLMEQAPQAPMPPRVPNLAAECETEEQLARGRQHA